MKTLKFKITILTTLVFVIGFGIVSAWTGPTSAPPGSNVTAPINMSTSFQLKEGSFRSATDVRAPIYFDYPSVDYFVDPDENSWLYRLYSNDIRSKIFYDLDDN